MSYKSNRIQDYESVIRQMLADGASNKEILQFLRKQDVKLTAKALENYLKELDLGSNDEDSLVPFIETQVINNVNETKHFDFNAVTFDEYFDDSNDLNIIEFLQKAHKHLVLKQLQIVAHEQQAFYLGESESQPIQAISKLRMLEDMLFKVAPYHILAHQIEALKVVKRMGYSICFEGEEIDV